MKVDLFTDPTFQLVWPIDGELPEEEKITIKLERLKHGDKRAIEDKTVQVDVSSAVKSGRVSRKKKSQSIDENMEFSFPMGSIKDLKLNKSIVGWKNVLDKDGSPIEYSFAKLCDMMVNNCGLSVSTYGSLEDELLDAINENNNMESEVAAGN